MKSTTRFKKNKRGIVCLNCKQPISDIDNFCSNCGQVNDELPLSIKQFISEFFSGFFSFDTRFFKTFVPLLFKPGKVPRDYIEGKRMRYVNPFQLYLHVTIIFFLLQGLFSALDEYKISGSFSKKDDNIATDSIIKEADKLKNKVVEDLAAEGINVNLSGNTNIDSISDEITDSIFKKYNISSTHKSKKDSVLYIGEQKVRFYIDSIFAISPILNQLKNKSFTASQKDSLFDNFFELNMNFIENITHSNKVENWDQVQVISKLKMFSIDYIEAAFKSKKIAYTIPEKNKISVEDELLEELMGQRFFKKVSVFMEYDEKNKDVSVLEALDNLGYEKTRWHVFYYKKAQDLNKFKNDPEFRESYVDDIVSKISIALFFMLPIFTWFISLLYIRGKKNYTEHLVLVFSVQTVFFILLIFFTLFDRIFKTDIGMGVFFIVFLFYLYKSLRNFYKQNRFKTIIKYWILNTIYVILSSIGVIIISFLAFVL